MSKDKKKKESSRRDFLKYSAALGIGTASLGGLLSACSTEKTGEKCAEIIEKEINAEVRGTLANKNEKATGTCALCKQPAKNVVYVGKSY